MTPDLSFPPLLAGDVVGAEAEVSELESDADPDPDEVDEDTSGGVLI